MAGGEGDDSRWDGWMASPTQWTWVCVTPGVGDGQKGLMCCSPWRHKKSDTTEQLNWTEWSNSFESWVSWSCTWRKKEGASSVSFKISANVWNMSKIPMFICHFSTSSLDLNAATFSANLNTVVFLPWDDSLSYWTGWICHISRQVVQPILCHWSMLPVVTFFLKEISGAALVTPKLWPFKVISLLCMSHLTENVCTVSISSESCANRHELRVCSFMWLMILITSWKCC